MNRQHSATLVVVIGVSGSGKSTIARGVAEALNFRYLDADDFHSAENKAWMAGGKPLTDAMRLPWVHAIRSHLQQLAQQQVSCTLAFSGLRRQHRSLLHLAEFRCITLYLKGSAEQILARMQARKNHFMPPQLLQSQFAALESPEGEPGVFTIDIGQSIQQCVHKSCAIIEGGHIL